MEETIAPYFLQVRVVVLRVVVYLTGHFPRILDGGKKRTSVRQKKKGGRTISVIGLLQAENPEPCVI